MPIQATLALKKIASLRKRIKVIQGGQGAGKTISILILLINHASSNPDKEIIIASYELTKMRLTVIKDFVKVMKLIGLYEDDKFLAGTLYRFPNGSFIKFIGLDKDDVGKGLRSDVLYINEANKCKYEPCRQLISRTGHVYVDHNPDVKYWAHTEYVEQDLCDFIILTFQDNHLLPEAERNEVMSYESKGYNPDGSIKNEYWANKWRVYGLGEVGILEGAILTNWTTGSFPDDVDYLWGLDWGSRDPFTLTKYHWNKDKGVAYWKNYVYQSNLKTAQIKELVTKYVKPNELIVADNANRTGIQDLLSWGFNAYPCYKRGKSDSLRDLQDYRIIVCDSPMVEEELINYLWADKRAELPIDGWDHAIDPAIYTHNYYKRNMLNLQ